MKTCEHCQKPFEVTTKHPKQKYCSVACRDAARINRVVVQCSWCGTPIERPGYRVKRFQTAFCSSACMKHWRRANSPIPPIDHPVHCDNCGAELDRAQGHINSHNFCNKACHDEWQRNSGYSAGALSPSWRGGHSDYRGPNWGKQRQAALKRDGHQCVQCGATRKLDVHHVKPFQTFTNYLEANELDNLQTLCGKCHTRAEWLYRKQHPDEVRLWPDTQRIHVCALCNHPYHARSPRSRYCPDCKTRTCAHCGKTFTIKSNAEVNKYCSRKCAGTAK